MDYTFLLTLMMDPIWGSKRWCKNSLTVDSPIKDSKSTNHRSLKSNILSRYGGDTWSEILALKSVRVRIKRRASPHEYLFLPSYSSFIIFLLTLMMDPIWDSKRWCKNSLTVDSPINSKSTHHRSLKSNFMIII